ncbi:Ribosomal large subunit pseudouridine synthase D [subsurface metagenome]
MAGNIQSLKQEIKELKTAGLRIDRYISEELKLFSRSQVRLRVVQVILNGKQVKLAKKLKNGDLLEIFYNDPPAVELEPEAMELDILFENQHCLVINKPQGLVVHPGCGHSSGTLVNGLLYYVKDLKRDFAEEPIRPGIVHRLDRDTSGVLVAAKSREAQEFLSRQFRERKVKKQYLAIVKGTLPAPSGRIDTRITRDPLNRKRYTCSMSRGKRAVTKYRVLKNFGSHSLVSLRPLTGRTHQLRVHMLFLECPILGDSLYHPGCSSDRGLMLHAYRLLITPPGEKEPGEFRAPLPRRFKELLAG